EAQLRHTQKLESLGALGGGIAHNFNNLLAVILAETELIRTEPSLSARSQRAIKDILTAAGQASQLTHQILVYSGQGSVDLEPVDLCQTIKDMARLLEVSVSKKVTVVFDLPANLPMIQADPSHIRQIMMNCIANASEAIGEQTGIITVSASEWPPDREAPDSASVVGEIPAGPCVCLEVRDTGCGMDAETVGKIFDPFFSTKLLGRGLGLAAVMGIVGGHHGAILIESTPGEGSTFRVLLPCTGTVATAPAPPTIRQPAALEHADLTVLIVEDEEVFRTAMKELLEEEGFAVLTAGDGVEALDVYRAHADEISIVLLDMVMPRMNGRETYEELCKLNSDVKVILASGYDREGATLGLSSLETVEFIQKPFQLEELLGKIHSLLA
ncbi:hypothetical protein LCGC14_2614350, partial [marine sediment metagenome]